MFNFQCPMTNFQVLMIHPQSLKSALAGARRRLAPVIRSSPTRMYIGSASETPERSARDGASRPMPLT